MKTVLISGGATGIGAAACELFAENGYNTAIGYNTSRQAAARLEEKLSARGLSALTVRLDITSPGSVAQAVALVAEKFGRIDVLVNNAGISQQKLFTDISETDWFNMINTNLGGAFRLTKAVLPRMISCKSGAIVNVSSMWGVTGASCEVHYSAAKAGLIGLTKALAKEVGPSGIRVNCVAPGVVDTAMNSNLSAADLDALKNDTPLEKIGAPADIAECIYFFGCEKSGFVTGQVLGANGGIVI